MSGVVVTGASGLLGRALYDELKKDLSLQVAGWAMSRLRNGQYTSVDLVDGEKLLRALQEAKPSIIVHSAAERRPDKLTKAAEKLNIEATRIIADFAGKNDVFLIYISTDYVFDGSRAPYREVDKPNPLNDYGRQKLRGEMAVQGHSLNYAILRVPILYGPYEYLGEGAVDVIFDQLLKKDTPNKMNHFERRMPTHVEDVARAVHLLITCYIKDPLSIHGIYHWSNDEEMTKYNMAEAMCEVFGLTMTHMQPVTTADASSATRPFNARLSTTRLRELGMINKHNFRDGIKASWRL